jgi:hypothetical protein
MTNSYVIKISANCYREFHAMIDHCSDNEEDEFHSGLWTALGNASHTSKGYQSPRLATLDKIQIEKLRKWIDSQIDYLLKVTVPQCNDDRDYKSANGCRYTAKGLRLLEQKLAALLNPDTPSD